MNYRSHAELIKDTQSLIPRLSRDYDGIISIPRSGNIPGNILALHYNIPAFTMPEFLENIWKNKFSGRQRTTGLKKFLVIDDSTNTGARINMSRKELAERFPDCHFDFAAIYAAGRGTATVDFFAKEIPGPRVFEWNFAHHGHSPTYASDIDGVVCPDFDSKVIDELKNEDAYIDYISNAPVKIWYSRKIHSFVTSRVEKYRGITETWLKKNDFQYEHLIMSPHATTQERRKAASYGPDKAAYYAKNPNIGLFIESSVPQARQIHEITGRPVLCIDNNTMFSKNKV